MKKQYLSYFFDYLIDIKITRSDGTYRFYESHLSHFGRFLFENNITALENVSKAVLVEYLSLLRSSVQNSTINKRIGIIKRCFTYYNLKDSYVFTIPKFKEKTRSFEMIPDTTLKRIITYINNLPERLGNNLMYKGVIHLLINTGVRINELYNIEKRNVILKSNEILLTTTKNDKDRTVYFLPSISEIVKKLLEAKSNHKYLVVNYLKDRKLNYDDIFYLFRKIKRKLKIQKLHPHMFRHTYATKLLQYGVDLKTVMDLMGHNNLATTQRYQHSSKEHAKKTYLEKYKY